MSTISRLEHNFEFNAIQISHTYILICEFLNLYIKNSIIHFNFIPHSTTLSAVIHNLTHFIGTHI